MAAFRICILALAIFAVFVAIANAQTATTSPEQVIAQSTIPPTNSGETIEATESPPITLDELFALPLLADTSAELLEWQLNPDYLEHQYLAYLKTQHHLLLFPYVTSAAGFDTGIAIASGPATDYYRPRPPVSLFASTSARSRDSPEAKDVEENRPPAVPHNT